MLSLVPAGEAPMRAPGRLLWLSEVLCGGPFALGWLADIEPPIVEAKGPPVPEHQKTTRFHVIGSIASRRLLLIW